MFLKLNGFQKLIFLSSESPSKTLEVFYVCLSATVEAQKDSGLYRATKPFP